MYRTNSTRNNIKWPSWAVAITSLQSDIKQGKVSSWTHLPIYGTTQADRGNALFVSFCLVYCKACSSWTKTGKNFFFANYKANWCKFAKKIIAFNAKFIVAIFFQNRLCHWVLNSKILMYWGIIVNHIFIWFSS